MELYQLLRGQEAADPSPPRSEGDSGGLEVWGPSLSAAPTPTQRRPPTGLLRSPSLLPPNPVFITV